MTTAGRGPQWLKNLYFTYLVELRALAKAAPYLEQVNVFLSKFMFVCFLNFFGLCFAYKSL